VAQSEVDRLAGEAEALRSTDATRIAEHTACKDLLAKATNDIDTLVASESKARAHERELSAALAVERELRMRAEVIPPKSTEALVEKMAVTHHHLSSRFPQSREEDERREHTAACAQLIAQKQVLTVIPTM
jgi:hypothetical protein